MYCKAIQIAQEAIGLGGLVGHNMRILDLGDSFVYEDLLAVANTVSNTLDHLFLPSLGVRLLGGSGRLFCIDTFVLTC